METTVPTISRESVLDRPTRTRSNLEQSARRFARQKLAMAGLIVVLVLVLAAIFAPIVSPTGYAEADLMSANKFPSWDFPFGTDPIGHNYLSRMIYGIRTSLLVGFMAVAIACLFGVPLGLVAGLRGGFTDTVV